jgi:hypothetical protein
VSGFAAVVNFDGEPVDRALLDRMAGMGRRDPAEAADAELLLHAYAASGTRCVNYLPGDFGFALWDKGNRLVWCATDHMGIRPVFHERHTSTVVISNTLDRVRLDIRATFVNDDYVWTWCTELPGSLRFEQNPLHALAASMEELKSRAGNAVPSLGQDAAIDAFILKALDGRTSVMAAAEAVMTAYPGRFKTRANATSRVGDLAVRYGKVRA